jgi:hypothetical protein
MGDREASWAVEHMHDVRAASIDERGHQPALRRDLSQRDASAADCRE